MEEKNEELIRKLGAVAREKKLSLQQIADQLGVRPQAVRDYIAEVRRPYQDIVKRIEVFLNDYAAGVVKSTPPTKVPLDSPHLIEVGVAALHLLRATGREEFTVRELLAVIQVAARNKDHGA